MIWVMEDGGRMGLNGASSAPDGGCSFTFIVWCKVERLSEYYYICVPLLKDGSGHFYVAVIFKTSLRMC